MKRNPGAAVRSEMRSNMKMSKKTTRILLIVLISLISMLTILLLLIGLSVCNKTGEPATPTPEIIEDTPKPTPGIIEVQSISIMLESEEIVKGTRFIPEIIIQPADATDKTFELYSGDEEILRPLGRFFLAVGVGTTDLVATTSNGVTGIVTVTVVSPLEAVVFSEDEIIMNLGDSLTLAPTTIPEDAIEKLSVTFTSDNHSVATVKTDGTVRAVGVGTASIECTIDDFSATVKITVISPIRQIIIDLNRRVYSIGDKVTFSVRINPDDATDPTYSVELTGAEVSTVGKNTFTCSAAGEVTITVTAANGVSDSVTVRVHDLHAFAEEVHRLTNVERANAGLAQLEKMPTLAEAAIVRANEIIESFSHTRPDGRTFATALDEKNIPYHTAGENLAAGQKDPAGVVKAWMDSPDHRDAILESAFSNIGIGVTMDGDGRLYWTQLFTN